MTDPNWDDDDDYGANPAVAWGLILSFAALCGALFYLVFGG